MFHAPSAHTCIYGIDVIIVASLETIMTLLLGARLQSESRRNSSRPDFARHVEIGTHPHALVQVQGVRLDLSV